MNRPLSLVALTALALATAACGPETNQLTPISNPSVYSVHQPVVQETNYVLDLASGGGGLSAAEQGRLASWFDSLDLHYGDRVSVQGGGYADDIKRQDVATVAGEFGLLLSEGVPPVGSASSGALRVVVNRSYASVPGCPNWEDPVVGGTEQTSTNYGCATNTNLARMIADPNDLVRGQTSGPPRDALTGTKAIRSYRERTGNGSK